MNSIHDILTTKEMLTHHNGLITGVHITFYVSPLVQTGGLVLGLIAASTILGFLHFSDNRKDENVLASVFAGFTEGRIWAFILTWILQYIFTLLWTLLLIIPGIIKAYSYAMSIYIVDDLKRQGKNLFATEAITRSKHLMKGHKWELFVLDLSFLGWWFLATLTLGIGYLWLYPYILTTRAEFYRCLIAQNPTVLAD